MKKIYARECDNESFCWEAYLDEDTLAEEHIAIYGNRNYGGMNTEMISELGSAMDNAADDIETAEDLESPREIIEYYFTKQTEDKEFSDEECTKLVELSQSWANYEKTELLLEALKIIYGMEFTSGTIRGCSQGEWNNYIAPKSTDMRFIEAVYFGTGTEFQIACEATEEEPDWDEVDCYYDYTHLYRKEDIKNWIAASQGCTADEVALVLIARTYQVVKHEYKTV